MKTLYITRGNNIVVDTENNVVDKLKRDRAAIDDIFLIDEPMHVVYGYDDKREEIDVEKGDIVVTFYTDMFSHDIVVIKNNEKWVENIQKCREEEQAEKERWACEKCNGCISGAEKKDNH